MANGLVPAEVYYARERFESEKQIFRRNWINIAEEMEIPDPGDWVVRDIKMFSALGIIVRGKDGEVRAFHNICSHRGMKLGGMRKAAAASSLAPIMRGCTTRRVRSLRESFAN